MSVYMYSFMLSEYMCQCDFHPAGHHKKKEEDGVGAISSLSGHLVSQSPLFTPLQQLTGLISPPDRRKTSKIYNYDCYCSVLLQRTGNNTGTHSEQFSSP